MKKNLLLVLLLLLPVVVSAYDFKVDGIYYNIINVNEVEVTYEGSSGSEVDEYIGAVAIPTSVTYNGVSYAVTAIGRLAFYGCDDLTSIDIPKSVTSIGKEAFSYCKGLTSIKVADDNPTYDSRNGCNAIIETSSNTLIAGCQSTIIPNTVTAIGEDSFLGCSSLTVIEIPNSVISIGNEAFQSCSGLTSIEIPNSVTTIGKYAFSSCSNLTSISIGSSVKTIGNSAFLSCAKRSSIVVANNNQYYDSRDNCNAIIETSSNTLILGSQNSIPNSVTAIGYGAFYALESLTSIDIPKSVTSIGKRAFSFCKGLTSIKVADDNPTYDSRNGCNAIIETSSNTLIAGCQSTIIPNTVTAIGEDSFLGCSSLTVIEIPNSVISIGNEAFQSCSGLTSIEIPNSVTTIGKYAFSSCSNLTSISIGSSVKTIGNYAFSSCKKVGNVTCYSTTPPSCSDNCFSYYTASLHVPAASLAAYFTAPCWENFENIVGDAVVPEGISISKDSVNLQLDEQLRLVATVTPDNASNKEITWISTDTTVATVNDGLVLAVGYGECDIIASCFGMRAICHVLVANIITLDQQEAMLLPNHLLTLTPSAPTTPDSYAVSSSDPTVAAARILSSGIVQVVGIKEGTTTITVSSVDGNAIPATCLVTVYTEPGDMNSDGFVNISDVTSLIDYLLNGDSSQISTKNADVNGDGHINISDVTALIDTLLHDE